ncbi:hypothetical protein BH24ACT3_BH24ACT3_18070 [soil metagenome]
MFATENRLDALREAIDALAAFDPAELSGDELSAVLVDRHRQTARLAAARVALTGAWDRRLTWSLDGAKSGGAWLAHRARLPKSAAHGEVHLARRLRTMPATAEAFAAGRIGDAQAKVLARANRPDVAELFTRDEQVLVGAACGLSNAELCRSVTYWEQLARPDRVGWLGSLMALPMSLHRDATTPSSSAPARSARVAVCRACWSWSTAKPDRRSASERSSARAAR